MKNRIKMLKVKIKSLAEEARIIRLEELRAKGRRKSSERRKDMGKGYVQANPDYAVIHGRDLPLLTELHQHRVCDVRQEQRASLLAYAFLRGKTLAACEPKSARSPDWGRVLKLVEKFGDVTSVETKAQVANRLAQWREAASAVAQA